MAIEPDGAGRTLVYAGVDEAGYGPLLGPLCVGLCVLRLRSYDGTPKTPNVWRSLRSVVRREPDSRSTKWIAVNDSKRLKLANTSKAHPLTHLERGVLCFARQLERLGCDDDASLFDGLGCALSEHPWYVGAPIGLPLATTPDHVRLLTTRLKVALDRAGIEILDMRCRALCERTFNERLRSSGGSAPGGGGGGAGSEGVGEGVGNKARVSFDVVGSLIRRVWKSEAAGASEEPARMVVDRQGGRRGYAGELARVLPGARVRVVEESARASVYDVEGEAGDGEGRGPRRMRVIFEVEAEMRHFPVALSSMTAKLVRELSMMRLNRYWGDRIGEIKPTAGYRTDARRWLEDARRLGAPEDELRLLCRDA